MKPRSPVQRSACAVFIWIFTALSAITVGAQNSAQQRSFHVSKAAVEKALHDLPATTGGKLPTLEGFAIGDSSLDRYQRGYYDYSLNVVAVNSNETVVRVTAKITAWYKGDSSADSGYRVLTSNGRLESDLLDNLDDGLKSSSTSVDTAVKVSPTPSVSDFQAAKSLPNAPSSAQQNSVLQSAVGALPEGRPQENSAARAQDRAREKRAQRLIEQGNSLRDVLRNQTRPSNLAVIKSAKTPILEHPLEGSKAVLVADTEDEFQIVDSAGEWVHVQVSGISRGWLRRDQVDLPSATMGSLSTLENDPRSFDRPPAFQLTRAEVSVFPGKWKPLDGKKVKIIWVQPSDKKSFGPEPKLKLVKSVFRNSFNDVSSATPPVAGVVVILDSEDGGMAATTTVALQQWHAGHLPDGAFWKRCLLDPAEAFKTVE